jgi:hypothetical protein
VGQRIAVDAHPPNNPQLGAWRSHVDVPGRHGASGGFDERIAHAFRRDRWPCNPGAPRAFDSDALAHGPFLRLRLPGRPVGGALHQPEECATDFST